MKIEGSYTFDAPRDLLWLLLHDVSAIQQSIPGCDHFYLHADGKYHVSLTLPSGPFDGHYEGLVTRIAEQLQESIHLSLTGSGPELVFQGEGVLTLHESDEQTRLVYEGDVEVAGMIPTQSPRLTKTTANYLVRNFLEGLDRKVKQSTGITDEADPLIAATAVSKRATSTLDIQDFLAELQRDRKITVTVLILALLASLSFLGAALVTVQVVRWLKRSLSEG
ncbi:MAG: CoxG family protein [Candidatus Promineifilaceae bacterium]|jgi:carbon monoxide dehydrogenase subunit G